MARTGLTVEGGVPDGEGGVEWRFLYLNDIQRIFGVGRSKARLMLDRLQREGLTVRIGGRDAVREERLLDYIDAHGGIEVSWPKRKRRG